MEQLTLFKDMEETRNRNGHIVNEQGRECTECREFKVWDSFSVNNITKHKRRACCKECQSKKVKERRKCPKRLTLFNSVEKKYKFGDIRKDGMVFYSYSVVASPKKNFENWITMEAYEIYLGKIKQKDQRRRGEFAKKERKLKRGHVREDGMVFFQYSQTHAAHNFELWLNREDFELMCFDDCQKKAMRRSLEPLGGKNETTNEIRGLSGHDFRCYIESLFEDGMTWKNRGNWEGNWDPNNPKWHVDHTLPLSSVYNLEDKKHLWHHTNLRPMWGNENLAKSNKHCKKELSAYLEERKADE